MRSVLVAVLACFLIAPASAQAWSIKHSSATDAGSRLRFRITTCVPTNHVIRFKVLLFEDDGEWIDPIATRRWRDHDPDPEYCYRHTFWMADDYPSGDYAAQMYVRYRGKLKWAPVQQFAIY